MRARQRCVVAMAALSAVLALLASLASAEVSQKNGVRVSVSGKLAPTKLPRHGTAPIRVSVSGRIGGATPSGPPQLRTLTIAINRNGRLFSRGIPLCRMGRIDPSTTQEALAACGPSLVGQGSFSANVKLPEQSPFPSQGKVLAFNGRLRGKPAIFAQIYGTKPVPTSYVLPFLIKSGKGEFGTTLAASLPQVTGDWGFVTGISISLDRRFTYKGESRSFLTAGCPAPSGIGKVAFALLRTTFGFDGGFDVTNTLTRTCEASG